MSQENEQIARAYVAWIEAEIRKAEAAKQRFSVWGTLRRILAGIGTFLSSLRGSQRE